MKDSSLQLKGSESEPEMGVVTMRLKGSDHEAGGNEAEEGLEGVPNRIEMFLVTTFCILGSVALMLNYIAFQDLVHKRRHQIKVNGIANLCTPFAIAAKICWFVGFLFLVDWLHNSPSTEYGRWCGYCKLFQAFLFTLGPVPTLMKEPVLGDGQVWWGMVAGSLVFLVGNVIGCADYCVQTPAGASKKMGWLYNGNMQITSMWIFQLAAWVLAVSNTLTCNWGGSNPSKQFVQTDTTLVYTLQVVGSALLIVASLLSWLWCYFGEVPYDAVHAI